MLDSDKFSAIICFVVASVAHLVERHLAKVEVAGSSPVTRSKKKDTLLSVSFFGLFVRTDRCPLPAEHPPFPGLWPERNLFMELLCKWNQLSLVKRILIGLILGAVLGFLLPGASFLSLLGTLFVGALKALAPLLVFFLVLHSLAQHKKGAKSNMSTVIALYLIGTLLAALCAVVASFLFPSTLALAQEAASSAPGGIGEILQTLLNNAVSNPISAMAEANYIGVLLWAVGCGLRHRPAGRLRPHQAGAGRPV